MRIVRAEAMGLCFGVRDALEIAGRIERPERVTIYGELVHNETVLVQLDQRGFRATPEADRSAVPETPDVLVTAHGLSDAERQRLEAAGKRLIDTTCPLVRRVHRAAQALEAEGFHVLVVGRAGHVEVRGIVEDLSSFAVLERPEDVPTFPQKRLGVVCQTTTPPALADAIRAAIRRKNPQAEIRFVDTICQPTRERQQAVERLLRRVDAMVVVGGRNSNNTRQLLKRCREAGVPALHVQNADELQPAWFQGLKRCRCVGLTAGTSTLDETIQEVHAALCRLANEMEETKDDDPLAARRPQTSA